MNTTTRLVCFAAFFAAVSAFAGTLTLSPDKDASAKIKFPDQNFGLDAILQVSAQTGFQKHVFATFTVSGIPAGSTVTSAQFQMTSQTTGTGRSITAHKVTDITWGETTITWNNQPALGAAMTTVSSFTTGAVASWDVTSLITGNGTFTVGLDGTFSGDTTFSSREGANPPQLVVNYSAASALPRPAHIVIVVEENKAASAITASNAPTLTAWKNSGANFTQYFGVANSSGNAHPSEPSYFQFFSGSDQGIGHTDACPPAGSQYTTNNLAHQFIAAGLGFTGYAETLPAQGSLVCSSGNYVRRHCPWISWQGTGTNQIAGSNSKILTPSAFASMDYNTLPALTIVIPNLQNDMHDGTITAGDTWANNYLSNYIAYCNNAANNSLFILIFDENGSGGDPSGTVDPIMGFFVGAMVKQGTYTEHVNHYCLLRTIEDMYGFTHVANAATATTITDCWK